MFTSNKYYAMVYIKDRSGIGFFARQSVTPILHILRSEKHVNLSIQHDDYKNQQAFLIKKRKHESY